MTPRTLDDLLTVLQSFPSGCMIGPDEHEYEVQADYATRHGLPRHESGHGLDWHVLPTYGGTPVPGRDVLSWDVDRVLCGTSALDLYIVDRDE